MLVVRSILNVNPKSSFSFSCTPSVFSCTRQSILYIIIKSSCFFVFHFLTLSHPYAEALLQLYELRWLGGDDIVERRLLGALVLTFWNLANSQQFVKDKATVDATGYVSSVQMLCYYCQWVVGSMAIWSYICISAWGLRCSFRQTGQCESLKTWDE